MNILKKLKYFMQKPKVVIIFGQDSEGYMSSIHRVLKNHFSVGSDVVIFAEDFQKETDAQNLQFLVGNSSLPILVLANLKDEEAQYVKSFLKDFPRQGFLILNFDDQISMSLNKEFNLGFGKEMTFGMKTGADLQASDVNIDTDINFKINYLGSSVPFWLEKIPDEKQIMQSLAAASVSIALGLNLIEVSEALKG